jgi:hypothetical protein
VTQGVARPVTQAAVQLILAQNASPAQERHQVPEIGVDSPAPAPALETDRSVSSVYGIYTDGSSFTDGIDGVGYGYSANLLGESQTWDGTTFTFQPANVPDAYTSTTIPLPPGRYSTLKMLATGVEGNQTSQAFTVTYMDGTTTTFTQSLSDWYTPQDYSGESKAVIMPYRNTSGGERDDRTFYLYGYSLSINRSKAVKSLTLPDNRNVVVLAVAPSDSRPWLKATRNK